MLPAYPDCPRKEANYTFVCFTVLAVFRPTTEVWQRTVHQVRSEEVPKFKRWGVGLYLATAGFAVTQGAYDFLLKFLLIIIILIIII